MKKYWLIIALSIAAMPVAEAGRKTRTKPLITLPIKDAMSRPAAKEKLNRGVTFYFTGQEHPPVTQSFGEAVGNVKSNAFNHDGLEACEWAFVSALQSLEDRALLQGANAVINIKSFYKRKEIDDVAKYECGVGSIAAAVTLKGEVVQLAT